MKRILLIAVFLFLASPAFAQEYTSNVWASFASVTNSAQTTWVFPYKSRTVTIMNGSAVPVCISFFGNTTNTNSINQDCTSNVAGQSGNGDNRVFRIPATQWITLNNLVEQGINLRSSGAAASPVTVIVDY